MKLTYWLYCSLTNQLITAVRCSLFAHRKEIIEHALAIHDIIPCGSALYPKYTPGTIRNAIHFAVIRIPQ